MTGSKEQSNQTADQDPYTETMGGSGPYGSQRKEFTEREHAHESKELDLKERRQEIRHKEWLYWISVGWVALGLVLFILLLVYALFVNVDPEDSTKLIENQWNFRAVLSAIVIQLALTLRFIIGTVWGANGNKQGGRKSKR